MAKLNAIEKREFEALARPVFLAGKYGGPFNNQMAAELSKVTGKKIGRQQVYQWLVKGVSPRLGLGLLIIDATTRIEASKAWAAVVEAETAAKQS